MSQQSAHLLVLSEAYAKHAGRSPATISNWIVGHARLFSRLSCGFGTTLRTYNRALQWFNDHWPPELPWPAEVPRPISFVSEQPSHAEMDSVREVAKDQLTRQPHQRRQRQRWQSFDGKIIPIQDCFARVHPSERMPVLLVQERIEKAQAVSARPVVYVRIAAAWVSLSRTAMSILCWTRRILEPLFARPYDRRPSESQFRGLRWRSLIPGRATQSYADNCSGPSSHLFAGRFTIFAAIRRRFKWWPS